MSKFTISEKIASQEYDREIKNCFVDDHFIVEMYVDNNPIITRNNLYLNSISKKWDTPTSINTALSGMGVWNNKTDYFYSFLGNQNSYIHLKLNKDTQKWETITWKGFTNFIASYIWTDGVNYYCSIKEDQYVIDFKTYTLTKIDFGNFNGLGTDIWTDNSNIYYDRDTSHLIFNPSSKTWINNPQANTWTSQGITGYNIWTDGVNIYYSNLYKFNKVTQKWENINFKGLPDTISGINTLGNSNIFNYYGNTFYTWQKQDSLLQISSETYILNKELLTWVKIKDDSKTIDFGIDYYTRDGFWIYENILYYNFNWQSDITYLYSKNLTFDSNYFTVKRGEELLKSGSQVVMGDKLSITVNTEYKSKRAGRTYTFKHWTAYGKDYSTTSGTITVKNEDLRLSIQWQEYYKESIDLTYSSVPTSTDNYEIYGGFSDKVKLSESNWVYNIKNISIPGWTPDPLASGGSETFELLNIKLKQVYTINGVNKTTKAVAALVDIKVDNTQSIIQIPQRSVYITVTPKAQGTLPPIFYTYTESLSVEVIQDQTVTK